MIDWWFVSAHAVWIAGLALLLAVVSYYQWLAGETDASWRDLSKTRSFRTLWTTGLFLTCAGLALTRPARSWAQVLWVLLALWWGRRMAAWWARVAAQRRAHAGDVDSRCSAQSPHKIKAP